MINNLTFEDAANIFSDFNQICEIFNLKKENILNVFSFTLSGKKLKYIEVENYLKLKKNSDPCKAISFHIELPNKRYEILLNYGLGKYHFILFLNGNIIEEEQILNKNKLTREIIIRGKKYLLNIIPHSFAHCFGEALYLYSMSEKIKTF